jgi:hypothetical protein
VKAVVVYESMYGNTHLIAEAIANGLRAASDEVVVASVGEATSQLLADADLIVVGGPTHVHGMSRENTRQAAVEAAGKEGSDLEVEPDAQGPGLRTWFETVEEVPPMAAAFDTRLKAPALVTGRASNGIAKRLRAHGATLVVAPMSFMVTKESHLLDEETTHALEWGKQLGAVLAANT